MRFSVVILTYKREEDLKTCVDSVLRQTLFPDELFVIDDDNTREDLLDEFTYKFKEKGVDFIYHKKDHEKLDETRGSSASRDLGIKRSTNNVVFILDDDLILDDDYFEKTMNMWEKNVDDNLIGVGGIIKNNRKKKGYEKIYEKIFGLTAKNIWDVNDVAFQTWDDHIVRATKAYYMHGGVCAYNKKLTQELKFSIFNGGREALEDIDFCLRMKQKKYYTIIEPKARVIHNHSLCGRESNYVTGVKEGRNRKIIFNKNCQKNLKNNLWFFWANFGWILKQFLVGKIAKGFGMVVGLFSKI